MLSSCIVYRLNKAVVTIESTDNKILSCSKTGKRNLPLTVFLCKVVTRDLRTSPGNPQEKNYTVGSHVSDDSWCTGKVFAYGRWSLKGKRNKILAVLIV